VGGAGCCRANPALIQIPVAVVDEALVKKYFADLDPIGMQIQVPIPNVTCKIIGFVGGAKYSDLAGPRSSRFTTQRTSLEPAAVPRERRRWAYSRRASFRTGRSASASFHKAKNLSYSSPLLATSSCNA
jgi:hypothetical protein